MEIKFNEIFVYAVITTFGFSSADILSSELKSHTTDNNYDITAIYKSTKNAKPENCYGPSIRNQLDVNFWPNENRSYWNDEFMNYTANTNCYKVEIHLRTNAIGLPITYDGKLLSFGNKDFEVIADSTFGNIFNYIDYDERKNWDLVSRGINDNIYVYDNKRRTASKNPDIKPYNSSMYIGILLLILNSRSSMEIFKKNHPNAILSHSFERTDYTIKTLVLRTNEIFWENEEYELRLKFDSQSDFGIKRIVQCPGLNEFEEVYTSLPMQKYPSKVGIYPFGNPSKNNFGFWPTPKDKPCYNGGIYVNKKCVCPPGFKGDNCAFACGPNKFGFDCTGICSMEEDNCKGAIICTNIFSCQCTTGYTGKFCEDECPRGYYGFGCNQKCSENCLSDECNIFSGACTKGCKNGYIMPNCIEKYPWLIIAPKLVSSNMQSMTLNFDLSFDNIGGSRQKKPTYYHIMYKPVSSEGNVQYTNIKYIQPRISNITETIDGLAFDTLYRVGVVLLSEDGNFNEDVKTAQYTTTCYEPVDVIYNLMLHSKDPKSITATWKKHTRRSENECKIYYHLTLKFNHTTVSENQISEVPYVVNFTNLLSSYLYTVEIRAHTALGLINRTEVAHTSTKPTKGNIILRNIKGNADAFNHSIRLTWELADSLIGDSINYTIKYKVHRYFSCSHHPVESNWTTDNIYGRLMYEILNSTPNTQYIINVEPSINSESLENTVFVKTPTSTPNLAPAVDKNQSLYITNQSVTVKWIFDQNQCTKLNGFFSGYHLILKNLENYTETVDDTKINTKEYVNLNPNTKYEIQIYIKNNDGYNPNYMLAIPFKTKSQFLSPVEDLTVYKKDSKQRAISLRWRYPEDEDIEVLNFIITMTKDNALTNFKEIRANKDKCTGWPNYYCATISNLTPKDEYTFKVKAVSQDYAEGGLPASVSCNFIDGFSDEPGNLRATLIGSNNITLQWDIPWILNGLLKSFIVTTEEVTALDMETCCASLPDVEINVSKEVPTYNCTLTNLKPGSTYSIGVLSKTSWYGLAKRIFVTTLSTATSQTETKILV
ncbi:tenascin-like [Adelges cooleyi]|uniref:tenascin-like n=1 Tax=Adelges cooleyi TaxID=133065 RepID=UPI00217F7E7A|nr:tenascin-like [Adelges cooleyi]